MTKETVKLPADLLASYGPLNHLAKQGLLLVNASIIESSYSGPLSCYFVNFSSKRILIGSDDPIAKICFHSINPPQSPKPDNIDEETYAKGLSRDACLYPKSFLNISGLKEEIKETVTKEVSSSIRWGGFFIAFLLLFNTLEPVITKWIWQSGGVVSKTNMDIQVMKDQLDSQKQQLDFERTRLELMEKSRQERYDRLLQLLQAQGKKL
jgi:hypothetical protein